ncbi:hypothetical protein SASPL_109649 [Salvia splendens]|uniref:Uncharacterized protein n=1 Tax=Salvia splendens TaxID=180675 RepID=A0A8X8YKD6_SALSN|nr:hypothetical protein SASPL_109649 [Salvia splendens]
MSSQTHAAPTLSTVTISYDQLKDTSADLSDKIELGFGPNGLGTLSVSNVPGYQLLRRNLLCLAPRYEFNELAILIMSSALFTPILASLPEDVKWQLEDPISRYNFGWSHGKEKLESGKPGNLGPWTKDTLKGSFYANPILDVPTNDQSLVKRYPSYCGPNIWPHDVLPELELAFKALGKLILDVGLLLAHHCDQYSKSWFPYRSYSCNFHEGYRYCGNTLSRQHCRPLCKNTFRSNSQSIHLSAHCPTSIKVVYGEDEIAYQVGETTEILSGGQLCATPHCVWAPKGEVASGVERSTFALFMQPNWDEKLVFPEPVNIHEFIIPKGSISFGDYTENVLDKYYEPNA